MKFILNWGNGVEWTLFLPPNALFWSALILAVLLVVHWHYKLRHREIQSRELKEMRDDHREKEIAGVNSEGHAGNRPEKSRRVHEQHSLQ